MNASDAANRELLERVNAADAWFHARKTLGLWAKRLDEPQTIASKEGPLVAQAGQYLCRGVEGELWPQAEASLLAKYEPTDEVDGEGFRRYDVKDNEHAHIMAAELGAPTTVQTQWGAMEGQVGDFLVKRYAARDTAFPEDVWIVTASVFERTYDRVDGE